MSFSTCRATAVSACELFSAKQGGLHQEKRALSSTLCAAAALNIVSAVRGGCWQQKEPFKMYPMDAGF
jgi:hypothetical protein